MKGRTLAALLAAFLAGALPAHGEQQVYLVDGSVLQGEVLSLDASQLLLKTAYAESLSLPRSQVAAILLSDGAERLLPIDPTAALPPAAASDLAEEAQIPPGIGTLELAIKGDALRSSVRYRDEEEEQRMQALNTLYLSVYLDDELVFEEADSSMEKNFRDRQWIFLRNHHRFEPVTLDVPSGRYKAHIVVGNKLDLLQTGEDQSKLVSAEAVLEDLTINPGKTTRVVLDGEGSSWGYGKYALKVLSRH